MPYKNKDEQRAASARCYQNRKEEIKARRKQRYQTAKAQRNLVGITEAAHLLGVCKNTLRSWEEAGKIVSIRTQGGTSKGGHRRYNLADLKALGMILKPTGSVNGLAVPSGFDLITTYKELTEYTLAFANGDIGFLLMVGSPGSGKSRQVRADLAGKPICWIDNHVTPMGLYVAAYEAHDIPIVLDDVNHFISTKQSCSLIKALTQTEDEKAVSWENPNSTMMDAREIPRSFTTRSPVCLIGNTWDRRNDDYMAIQDRALPVAFYPTAETIHGRVQELGWCDADVLAFIERNLANIPQPSMREYYNGMRYKRAKMDWRQKLYAIWDAAPVATKSEVKITEITDE
jgi:hypothetical protein